MPSLSFRQLQIVEDQLQQIKEAITNLRLWNSDMKTIDDWGLSPDGMKTLAANCMLIEAIGEGFKRIEARTNGVLLRNRPEIPWEQVISMRNHIAHGYFDINAELVWDVLQNDIDPLEKAVDYFLDNLYDLVPHSEYDE